MRSSLPPDDSFPEGKQILGRVHHAWPHSINPRKLFRFLRILLDHCSWASSSNNTYFSECVLEDHPLSGPRACTVPPTSFRTVSPNPPRYPTRPHFQRRPDQKVFCQDFNGSIDAMQSPPPNGDEIGMENGPNDHRHFGLEKISSSIRMTIIPPRLSRSAPPSKSQRVIPTLHQTRQQSSVASLPLCLLISTARFAQ